VVRAASPARLRLRRLTGTPELPYTLLDVFTDVRLAGNPLAVVHDADALDERTMLAFAIETKLSETSFVQTRRAAGADYRNRIFSMAGELPFAGHPSLGPRWRWPAGVV
jgi:PhzF family phenazine biosynthesis protein